MGDKARPKSVPPISDENQHLSGENQEIIEYLKKSRFFNHLPQELLQQLLPLTDLVDLPSGTEILTEGNPNTKIYFLMSGTFSVYAGGEFIIEMTRKGDVIGEMSCISGKPCSASVISNTPVKLFSIKARDIGKYTDASASELQDTLYRIFSMVLTDKLSFTTYKAKQYESTHKELLDEISEHKQARAQLVKYQDSLEQMVNERTLELSKINIQLQQEIDERKKAEETLLVSEERYHQLFESESDAIVLIDAQTSRLEDANQAALDLFGYTKKEILDLTIEDIQIVQEAEVNGINRDLEIDPDEMKEPWVYMKKEDGSIFPAEIGSGSYESKGQKKIIGSVRDITERLQAKEKSKKLEYQLRQSQKMEALGTLAGGIAHDFNNILGTILGFTELAKNEVPENSEEKEYLEEVYRSGERAADLVSQLLTFSRLEDPELKPIQLSILIKEVLKMMRATFPANIEIKQDLKSVKSLIMANSTQIHQVIVNLFSNAEYSMRDKGGIIGIKLEKVKHKKDQFSSSNLKEGTPYLKLSVSDTGSGMNTEIRDHIFEPFFTTKQVGEGSGLGLSVVHGIVKNHNGEITFKSNPEKGTAFQIFFPIVENRADLASDQISSSVGGSEHILVVEDECALAKSVKISLQKLGYKVTVVNESPVALKVFNAQPHRFDLVYTDMAMPKMTGYELSQKLLGIRPDIPIVLATGYSNLISEKTATAAGIYQFLSKPVKISTLTRIIRERFGDRVPGN